MLEKAEEMSRANTCSRDTAVKEILMRLLTEVRKKIFPINWTYLFFLSVEKCIDAISSCFHTLLMFSVRDLGFFLRMECFTLHAIEFSSQ